MPRAFPGTLRAPRAERPPPRASDVQLVRSVERVWRRVFARAGERYEPARVLHFGDVGAEPCAPPETELLGLYCPDGHRIFLSERSGPDWPYVVAHEVGHHVQELRGTFGAADRAARRSPRFAEDLHLRGELQADCYAGVWGHAARVPPPPRWFHHLPEDEPGTPEQRRRWLMVGHTTGRPGACDTFAAKSATPPRQPDRRGRRRP